MSAEISRVSNPSTAAAAQVVRPIEWHTPVKAELQVPTANTSASYADTAKQLHAALAQINQQMASSHTQLGFSLDKSVHGPVITVHNTSTGEVVRQIPSEEVLRVAKNIDSLKGVLFHNNF